MRTRDVMHPWGRSKEFRRASQRSVPITFIRSNGALFYAIGAASLLESLAPACAERLAALSPGDDLFCGWLRNDWAARRVARAHRLREYLALTWPEYDLAAAAEQFARSQRAFLSERPTAAAREALARCAATSQSALFYRCLARWAEDVQLREMAWQMAREDASAFARFSNRYETAARAERLGMWRSWRTAHALVRRARDSHVQSAFDALIAEWGPNAPFPPIEYAEFVKRVKAVIARYSELGWAERLVFRAWSDPPAPSAEPVRSKAPLGLNPVMTPDASVAPVAYHTWGMDGRRGITES